MSWLTLTHTQRWHQHRHSVGEGRVYQGQFKSFPVETNEYFLMVCRNVERNAVRAKLVDRAEAWRWSSVWLREEGDSHQRALLSDWPVERSTDWVDCVNQNEHEADLMRVRQSVRRSQPFGQAHWVTAMVERLGLDSTLRAQGRPRTKGDGHGF